MVGESVSRRHERPAERVAEDDYQSFCEALESTARGRAFLEEYARRNRQVDTAVVLAALDRLEIVARGRAAASPEADRIRQDLKALLDTLRSARPQSENSPTAIKAATLAALIDFTQARIEALLLPPRGDEALAAVPAEEQPELPIPHPSATAAPQIALVQPPLPPADRAPKANVDLKPDAAKAELAAQAKRKTATIIPIVEFDYPGHPDGDAAPARTASDEAWTALSPPSIAAADRPVFVPTAFVPAEFLPSPLLPDSNAQAGDMPAAAEPHAAIIAEPVAAPSLPDAAAPQKPHKAEVEPYELWLDPPAEASAEPVAASVVDPMPDVAIVADQDIGSVATADPVTETGMPTAEAALDTIETLMQQMEQAAAPAPAVKSHLEVADPLAPLMALSEEERIALFT